MHGGRGDALYKSTVDIDIDMVWNYPASVNIRLYPGPCAEKNSALLTEAPKESRGCGLGTGVPRPSRLGALGERRELSQHGPGRTPAANSFSALFECRRTFQVK